MSAYALELKDLRKSFGKTEIIRGVNLSIAAGERIADQRQPVAARIFEQHGLAIRTEDLRYVGERRHAFAPHKLAVFLKPRQVAAQPKALEVDRRGGLVGAHAIAA